MKKLIQLIFIGIMLVPMGLQAQQDVRNFVEQYKRRPDFTVITIGKPLMSIAGMIVKFSDDKDAAEIIKRINTIHVVNGEDDKTFASEALAFCSDNRYEELVEVVESGETTKILGKIEGKIISELIFINSSKVGSSVMVCLSGRFDMDDVGYFRKNIK
jgi:hypothetical protein